MPILLFLLVGAAVAIAATKRVTPPTTANGVAADGTTVNGDKPKRADVLKHLKKKTTTQVTVNGVSGLCPTCPFEHSGGPGGHAPFKLRPGEEINTLFKYYNPGTSPSQMHTNTLWAGFTRINPEFASETFVQLRDKVASASAAGATVLIPGSWNPYNQPVPNPGVLTAAVPTHYPPFPPIGPIQGIEV
jgi:hypothetical protein